MIRPMHYTYFVDSDLPFFRFCSIIGHRKVDGEVCTEDRAKSDFSFLFGTSGCPL